MRYLLSMTCALALLTGAAAGDAPTYPSPDATAKRLRALVAAHPDHARLTRLGRSYGDRPVWLLRLAAAGDRPPERRPALLIVAGLDGGRRLGTELALAAAAHLLTTPDALTRRTVYVVALANPDGAARFASQPLDGMAGNDRRLDRDRDGERGEDGHADLDGDGVVRWMRVPDPAGEWRADEHEPRLMTRADRLAGERGTHRLVREGATDDDGDGAVDEDPRDGARVDQNFPHRFQRLTPTSGRYASSEPAAHALIRFVVDTPQVALVLTYGADDNLVALAKPGKVERRKPLTAPHPDDHPWLARLGDAYRKATGAKGKPRAVPPGAFFEWCYYHRGLPSLAVRGWHGFPVEGEKKPKSKHPDVARLLAADRLGRGFADWKAFEHPTLGAVEIGGFTPGFGDDPPFDEVAALAAKEAPFAASLLDRLPELSLALRTERVDGDVVRVVATVRNAGWLPSELAQGRRTRQVQAPVVALSGGQVLGGEPDARRVRALPVVAGSGGQVETRWLLRWPEGAAAPEVELRTGGRGFDTRRAIPAPAKEND